MDRELALLEDRLDSFDPVARRQALVSLRQAIDRGLLALPPIGDEVNLHCHSFFSYNPYGHSPSSIAWLARKAGLAVAGIVDFDVLDGLEDFVAAGSLLDLRTCVGLETRVYVRQFADKVINSPGEPGIAYQMGVGFPSGALGAGPCRFLARLRTTAAERNRALLAKVNDHLAPVVLDYERDVLPLTPSGNATERHICLAYARKARSLLGDGRALAEFWSGRLGEEVRRADLPESFELQSLIRARTMKRGGVGYVQPGEGSFPEMAETVRSILEAGAIPTHCWLDGASDGERRIEDLLAAVTAAGVAAVNIIVNLDYGECPPRQKAENTLRLAALLEERDLLVVAGTEMNSPGQAIVNEATSRELAPLRPAFLKSAYVIYAHSVLQRAAGLGYTSDWAERRLSGRRGRNEYYREVGECLTPSRENLLDGLHAGMTPQEVLGRVRKSPGPRPTEA